MRFSAPFRKAQSDAHSELTPNFAAQAAAKLLLPVSVASSLRHAQRRLRTIYFQPAPAIPAKDGDFCYNQG
ncbi:hypothetical protein [Lapidilactobacillus salsurivasis]